jgi:hypothetical protein
MVAGSFPGPQNRGLVLWLTAVAAVFVFKGASTRVEAACPEVCLDVTQGSRYFGRFPPISTPTDVQDFYHYKHYSFNGDDKIPLLIDQSLLLIHYFDGDGESDGESETCDLSMVIVHDSKDDNTGGQAYLRASGNHEVPLVQDGPGDGSLSDRYLYVPSSDHTELFWEWGWQPGADNKYRTDGMADTWDATRNDGCLEVSAKFIAGIVAWRFVPGPLDKTTNTVNPKDYLYLDMDETVRICKVECGQRQRMDL